MKLIFSRLVMASSSLAVVSFLASGVASYAQDTANAKDHAGKACYEQFSVAKKAGTLKEKNFKEFKAAHCAAEPAKHGNAVAAKDTKENKPAQEVVKTEKTTDTQKKEGEDKSSKKAAKTAKTVKEPDLTNVVFPDAIDPKYAQEKEGTGRQKTCLDQYNANKATGKNGELKWIQKGGGYYSYCTKHLKK